MHRHPTADVLVVGLGPVKAPIPVQLAQAVSQVPDHPAAIYSALTPRGRWHLDGLRAGAGSHQCVTNQTKVAQTPTQMPMVAHWTARLSIGLKDILAEGDYASDTADPYLRLARPESQDADDNQPQ